MMQDAQTIGGGDKAGQVNGPFDYYPSLRRVRRYVESNYDRVIRLEDAAREACYERTYFSSFFSRRVGTTFSSWLSSFRIQKAIELMTEEDYSITEIAHRVGFSELSSFGRVFRKLTATSPREFKRSLTSDPVQSSPDPQKRYSDAPEGGPSLGRDELRVAR
jgi:AraC-like DNA-binding protein